MQRLRTNETAMFRSKLEAEAADLLLHSLRGGEPVVVMTGRPGGGKTTVLDAALAELGPDDPRVLRLEAPFPAPLALQRRFAALLDLSEAQAATPADIARALLLMPAPAPGVASLAVVVDGAEAVPPPVLQYLWLMHTLTCLGRPALQLVLVGSDSFWRLLANDALADLRRGVTTRLAIEPFNEAEARAFLRHLLHRRGCRADADAAAELVAKGAGIPGRIVMLLDAACADLAGSRVVSLPRVRAAMGMPPRTRNWATWIVERPLQLGLAAVGLLLAVASWQLLTGGLRAARQTPPRLAANPAQPGRFALPPAREAASKPPPTASSLPKPAALPAQAAKLPATASGVAARRAPASAASSSTGASLRWAPLEAAVMGRQPVSPLDAAAFLRPRSVGLGTPPAPAPVGPAVRVAVAPLPPISTAHGVGPAPVAVAAVPPPILAALAPRRPAAPPSLPPVRPSGSMLVMSDATAPGIELRYPRGDEAAEARATRAVQALRRAGLATADAVAVSRPFGLPGVGYYFTADRDTAQQVARTLAGIASPGPVRELPMLPVPPPPGTIEVLLTGR